MKTATAYKAYRNVRPAVPYPNAATTKEMLQKFLDGLLMVVSGAGIAVMLMFLLLFL